MFKALFKNWKTTLTGIGGGLVISLGEMIKTGDITKERLITSIVLALIGCFAKDGDKTGI